MSNYLDGCDALVAKTGTSFASHFTGTAIGADVAAQSVEMTDLEKAQLADQMMWSFVGLVAGSVIGYHAWAAHRIIGLLIGGSVLARLGHLFAVETEK